MEGLPVSKSVALSVAGIAVAGALVASPALADGGYPIYGGGLKDEVLYAPPPITWAGFYVGLHAGYGWGNSDWKALEDIPPVFAGETFSHDPEGGLVGGQIGYNGQSGPFVWGIEATLSGTDINEETRTDFGILNDAIELESSIDTLWTVTGRLGYAWGPLLTYVKAGYAGADVELSVRDPFLFEISESQTHHGWTVGAGLEYLASENLVLGLEYNYYDLGEEDYGRRFAEFRDGLVENDLDLHTVTARVSYKFNFRDRAIPAPLPPLK